MGAPVLRPPVNGPVLDAGHVADLLGMPKAEVFRKVRAGELPAPMPCTAARHPRVWRWSRRLIRLVADGRWQPGDGPVLDGAA